MSNQILFIIVTITALLFIIVIRFIYQIYSQRRLFRQLENRYDKKKTSMVVSKKSILKIPSNRSKDKKRADKQNYNRCF